MVIYRPGAITLEQIRETAGPAELFKSNAALESTPREALPSPGVGLRHYAPKARLLLIEAALPEMRERLAHAAAQYENERIGIMLPAEIDLAGAGLSIYSWGRWAAPEELARNLYSGLRDLDTRGCTVILCPLPAGDGIGTALRDRLRKAAAADSI